MVVEVAVDDNNNRRRINNDPHSHIAQQLAASGLI
jgi:hypothetical protein